jgi:hypothetical protein
MLGLIMILIIDVNIRVDSRRYEASPHCDFNFK